MDVRFHLGQPPPLTPPHKGEGVPEAPPPYAGVLKLGTTTSPSPLWGGVGGGGNSRQGGQS
jgi:hypothetical protein